MTTHFSSERVVQAPPATVIAAITDLDSWAQWMPGLVRVERLTEGPFDLGTRWRETRKMYGKEASEVFQVSEYEPPGRLGLLVDGAEGSTGRGEYRFLYLLEPVPEAATRITLEGEVEMPGLVARLLAPMMKGMLRRGCERDLDALATHLESAPPPAHDR